jgi:DNA-binding SARP family transcriptional activator
MEFRLLGPLEIRQHDRPLPLGSAKQRALLALLLLSANRVVPRERLIDELWGDDPPNTAVQTVQVYVSRLRKLLGPEVLVTRPPGYVLVAPPGSIDLHRFEALLADARAAVDPDDAARALREALGLWHGPPLAEFREPFARAEGARLEDLRLAAVEARADADLARGREAELVGELELLIAEHPHRERLRGALMLALYRSGRQAQALEAFRAAREALGELGIQPSKELRALERAILNQDAELSTPTPIVAAAARLPAPLALEPGSPFVGRDRELDALRGLLARAEAGEGGQVALVGGEAGAGKSRLVREFARGAADGGAIVLYGGADATVNAPYQPFVEALEFLLRVSDAEALMASLNGGRRELARLLPELGPVAADADVDPETARRRLHAAVGELLARVGRDRPLLVIVDDIHWADGPSLHLLRDLARSSADARVLLLATYRDRSEDIRPELSEALAALARIDGVSRLIVTGLTGEEVVDFIRASIGEAAADVDAVASAVHSLTDGVPFLLGELWRELVETDGVDISGDIVRLARPLEEFSTPQSVRDVVHHRLSRLSPPTAELLELAAVAGSQFELRVIQEASGAASVVHAVEEALACGTIEELPGPGLPHRFSHELVRRALYDRLSSVRRAELHLRVGEALERVDPDHALPELAHHFAIATPVGGEARAVEYSLRAAAEAAGLFAYADVERFGTAAVEHARSGSSAWARAQHLLATAEHYLAKGSPHTRAVQAAAAFETLGDTDAAATAELLASRSLRNAERGEESNAAAARALALVRDGPPSPAKAEALGWWASTLNLAGGPYEEAIEFAREALALAEELRLVSLQVRALNVLGSALFNLEGGGLEELQRAVELGRGGVAPEEASGAFNNLALILYGAGRFHDAERLYEEALADVERFGFVEQAQWHAAALASNAFNLGDWRRAEAWIARHGISTGGAHRVAWLALNVQANIDLARGDAAAAFRHAAAGLEHARGLKQLQPTGRSLATMARVHLELGRAEDALPFLEELLAAVRKNVVALRWRGLIDLAWLLHDLGRPELPPVIPYPVWSDPAQAIARGEFAVAADLLGETELATEAAYARLRAAEQLAAAGRRDEAREYAEPAAAFYRSVEATAYLRRAEAVLPALAREG